MCGYADTRPKNPPPGRTAPSGYGAVLDFEVRETVGEEGFEGPDAVQVVEPDHGEQIAGSAHGDRETDLFHVGQAEAGLFEMLMGDACAVDDHGAVGGQGVNDVAAQGEVTVAEHLEESSACGVLARARGFADGLVAEPSVEARGARRSWFCWVSCVRVWEL